MLLPPFLTARIGIGSMIGTSHPKDCFLLSCFFSRSLKPKASRVLRSLRYPQDEPETKRRAVAENKNSPPNVRSVPCLKNELMTQWKIKDSLSNGATSPAMFWG